MNEFHVDDVIHADGTESLNIHFSEFDQALIRQQCALFFNHQDSALNGIKTAIQNY